MNNILKLCILFIVLFHINGFGQSTFPESWVGNYKGKLKIFSPDSVKMKVNMNLAINKTANDSIFDWTLTYEMNSKKDVRAYSLLIVDKEKGHYQIDENNSIIIDGYLHNNKVFTSFFKVSNSFVIATYTKKGNQLVFEIIAGKDEPVSTTGNTKHKEENIPAVYSYLVNGRQKAVLEKLE